jgi:hypothetical protein
MFPRFILTGDFESKHGLWLTNQNEARKKENAERIKNNQKEIPENDLLDVPWDVFKTQADIGLVLDDDEWRTEQVFKGSVSVEMVNGSIEGADSSGSGADEDQNFAPVTSDAHEQMNVNPMRTNKSQKPVDSVIKTALETADSTFPDLYGNVFMEAKIRPSQLNILIDQHLTMIGIPLGDALIMIDSFGSSQS